MSQCAIEQTEGAAGSLYVYLVSLVAAAAGLLFGFDIAVINGAIIFLRQQFGLSEIETGFAASSLLVGCVAGASAAGWLSDRFGRRRILILSALLFGLSSLGAALPRTLTEFTAARFMGGIAVGVASVLAPLYIAEVAPPHIRGRLVSLNQMAIVSGILLAYLVNWGLSFLGPSSWRIMFASALLPSLAFFIALFFVPESPRWLTKFGRHEEALAVLTRVGGRDRAMEEFAQIRATIAEESGALRQLLRPGLRTALLIAVVLAVLQQVTGINTVLFYGSLIFKEQVGEHSETAAIGVNVVVGIINFLCTMIAIWVIDKVGRKPLLMFSSGLMGGSLLAMGAAFLVQPPPATLILCLTTVCVAAFAVGMGPGVWVVMAEIFPTRIRGRAMSIATISLWSACVALTFTFLSLVRAISITGAFWLYASLCVVTFVFVWRVVPETKGKSLEEIEKLWRA
ncbi:MAG: sugar porter family MFS transporter [Acidobacteria bacterium]|nr:sugar porter family MFS transporter [Acidobacteriota bacterium]